MASGLQFNSHATNQDVVSEINATCNSDNNSYPLVDKARRTNLALDRFFTLAFRANGQWTYDDTNYNTDPIQTINLVSGTQSYDLGTFTSEILGILRVEALNSSSGDSIVLYRLDRSSMGDTALTEYQTTNGIPQEYDLVGETIYLYPAPSYSATNGLRIYLERNKSALVSTDTTKVLPVPSLFNRYICNLTSLPWLIENQKPQKNDIAALIAQDEVKINEYFANREKGIPRRMSMNLRNWR